MKKSSFRILLIAFFATTALSACKSKPKDSELQSAIESKIKATPELSGLSVAVQNGVATLSGEVKDEASKALGGTTAKSVEGIKDVVNNCTVAPPPSAPSPIVIAADDPLTKSVNDALKDYPTVKATVNDGVVTLTGELKKSSLTKLMQTLHTLKPKKIENQLTLK